MKIFQTNNDEIEKLKKRLIELEKKVDRLEGSPIYRAAQFTEDAMVGKFWKY